MCGTLPHPILSGRQLCDIEGRSGRKLPPGTYLPPRALWSAFDRDGAWVLDAEPISRFELGDEANLPRHAAALFADFRRAYGFAPNWLAALAVNPDTAYRILGETGVWHWCSSSSSDLRDNPSVWCAAYVS